jgi:hypothetical protein
MLDNKSQDVLDNASTVDDFKIQALDISSVTGSTVDLQQMSATTIPTLTINQGGTSGASGYYYNNAIPSSNITWQSPNIWSTNNTVGATVGATVGTSGRIDLVGESADIIVNGKSMMKMLERIEDRLNLLTTNPELEKDWDELRKLGDRYRQLEKKCNEKAETWKKLKAMPPPQTD